MLFSTIALLATVASFANGLVYIHPNGHTKWCLSQIPTKPGLLTVSPVHLVKCNGDALQKWDIHRGATTAKTTTGDCMECGAGTSTYHNGNGYGCLMKNYEPTNVGQQLWYTDDNRIAIKDQGMCLDLPDGKLVNDTAVQQWQCTTGNTNQIWTTTVA